ncbi:MAG: hypothetical protein JO135_10080 [Candidatus Eremiobacteraeota bacterium]|nr:hypothetical protein [Candidatus Eremiobacteraeota bacterium]
MKHAIMALAVGLALTAIAEAQTASGSAVVAVPKGVPASLDPTASAASAWSGAALIPLPWDTTDQRAASEPTTAYVQTDGKFIYVRFDAKQRESLLAQQHTNNVGDGTDDEVWVDLWPSGNRGFYYQFAATSNGTHYQYSSENSIYQPNWESFGAPHDGGYTVTMKIPIEVMRGVGSGNWKAQFARVIRSTGEYQVWTYDRAETNQGVDNERFSGSITGIVPAGTRPKPRVGLYTLGELGSPVSGLSTSRMGADISIPVTSTSSFYATLHPDFSNVEVDQQTIAPTAYQRFFTEVRPFFTQGNQFYNNFDCNACPGISELYTPGIPTPRRGYAFEGKQGPFSFAAFDAIGVGRSDAAQAFGAITNNHLFRFNVQRVAADCRLTVDNGCQGGQPTVHDDNVLNQLEYYDGKHLDAYIDYGNDSGSNVLVANRAQRYEAATYLFNNTFGFAFAARKIGRYYNPADGLIQHPDIAGYATYAAKIWLFGPSSPLNSIGVSGFVDRYHDHTGALDQTDNSIVIDLLTKSRIDAQVTFGSSYLLQNFGCSGASCVFTPISQNGIGLTWHSGTVNSPGNFPNHGSSSTPTTITFNTGRFGPGKLDTWTRSSTIRVGSRATLFLEADDTRQYLDNGGVNIQWLERIGYNLATGPNSSLTLGVRRIIGTPPLVFAAAPVNCTTVYVAPPPGAVTAPCTGAWNLSFAYHRQTLHDELYFAYGDASQLSTTPSLILKLIHYYGAPKGT